MNCKNCNHEMNKHTSEGTLLTECINKECDLLEITRIPEYFENTSLTDIYNEYSNVIADNIKRREQLLVAKEYEYYFLGDEHELLNASTLEEAIDIVSPDEHWQQNSMMTSMYTSESGLRIYEKEI